MQIIVTAKSSVREVSKQDIQLVEIKRPGHRSPNYSALKSTESPSCYISELNARKYCLHFLHFFAFSSFISIFLIFFPRVTKQAAIVHVISTFCMSLGTLCAVLVWSVNLRQILNAVQAQLPVQEQRAITHKGYKVFFLQILQILSTLVWLTGLYKMSLLTYLLPVQYFLFILTNYGLVEIT